MSSTFFIQLLILFLSLLSSVYYTKLDDFTLQPLEFEGMV
ncbi:hypothetical protein Anacy_4942 [Anabaena cylindrica PCC 7122]|uniref:Uncharacterized protein n=1 Tax=Anabaena cylindrica (strain ATCC 27899 / PCC 7122) TaxID=272123 RepID=K9ZP34_ANACC|nr:hypothetical protein Anacy_4942 [Anabaena cylindrica PCC 7122]BAY02648.1 hypothetical protein NIES19_18940 [Anabaena cylindrica PCC 7122]